MHILKIKNQFNTVFIFIMILALLIFFTANYFVTNVGKSYEGIIDNSLPIMNKSSKLAQTSAHVESSLIQLHFDATNAIYKEDIDYLKIDEITRLWRGVELLLDELVHSRVIKTEEIQIQKKAVEVYLENMPELLDQINYLLNIKKLEQHYKEDIEVIINYNNKILLVEMESYWEELINKSSNAVQLAELEYSYQFYSNSTQLLSYFRQVTLTKDIKILNLLKRKSVKLFREMQNSGSQSFGYKIFADSLLSKLKPLYSGEKSLFKTRYDVLRLKNVTDSLIQKQINTAKEIKIISDLILILMQDTLAEEKIEISNNIYKANGYLILLIVTSFILSFSSIWFLVNKNLINRITELRFKILELSQGNTKIDIEIFNKDEIGDMEKALIQLKGYVIKAKVLSVTDSLTGLLNNTQFKENLNTEIKRHSRQNQLLSLAMIDIDHFKAYNDHYGHPMGDKCLKEISTLILQTCKRAGEYAYRVGGEEFAILMPNTSAKEQLIRLKELQVMIQNSNIEHKKSTVSKLITVSIGIYCCKPTKDTTEDDFYNKADKALYKAKEDRNLIIATQCNHQDIRWISNRNKIRVK